MHKELVEERKWAWFLWAAPVLVLSLVLGSESVYVQEGVFFSKAAAETAKAEQQGQSSD